MNADINRRLENLIRLGNIKTIHPAKPYMTVTVDIDEITTAEIRYLNLNSSRWQPPKEGEEVIVFSPCGVLEMGVAFGGLNNEINPAVSEDLNKYIQIFSDGCILSYDSKNHLLEAILPQGGKARLKGDLLVDGTIHSTKNITSDADVIAGNISLKKHKTSGVKAGNENSQGPIP